MKKLALKLINNLGYEIKRNNIVNTFSEIDPAFNGLYSEAQEVTQMTATDNALRRQRHYTLNYLLKNAELKNGDVCEVGCWRGLSAYQIASHIASTSEKIDFHLFDSFEGLSTIEPEDRYEHENRTDEELRKQFACSLEIVQDNLKKFDFIKYYKGWVPQRFNEVADRKFSFVHVDVDLYQPIRDCFEFFYPRLTHRGIMVFDDYGYVQFPGAKKAVDQCLEKYGKIFFMSLPSGQAFLIKDFYK